MVCKKDNCSFSTTFTNETVPVDFRHMNQSNCTSRLGWPKEEAWFSTQSSSCKRKYPFTSCYAWPVPVDENTAQLRNLKQYQFTSGFLRSVWPNSHQPPTILFYMNEEDTATWVEMLGSFKGWPEARSYAQIFKDNSVTGYVLPFLSIKALRSELGIVKFGHRLEIIAAIENNELTLSNPVIISNQPYLRNMSVNKSDSFNDNSQQLKNPNMLTKEAEKWLSIKPKQPLLQSNSRKGGINMNKFTFPEADDPDLNSLKMSGETSLWNNNEDAYSNVIQQSRMDLLKSNIVKTSKSKSAYPSIPHLKLPPAMTEVEGNNRLNEITVESVRLAEERFNAIFNNTKFETTFVYENQPLKTAGKL